MRSLASYRTLKSVLDSLAVIGLSFAVALSGSMIVYGVVMLLTWGD